jgi:hypothetical protein
MVNRLVIATAVGAAAVAALVACDALVDLGPTATLLDSGSGPPSIDAGVDSRANVPETGAPDADVPDSMLSCGLPADPNKDCDNCTNTNCCNISTACGMNPKCAMGEQLVLDCVYDQNCVNQVEGEYAEAGVPGVTDLVNCVVTYCSAYCLPGTNCSILGPCCEGIPDADTLARTVCIGAVNTLNENNCLKVLNAELRRQLGESFCPGAPDSGWD